MSGQQRKVYFTQGHGEKDPTSTERDGYSGIADALKRENYAVEKTVLAQQGAVPDDASIVVVAGPKNDFLPPEIDALKKYLDKQGKLLLALDPPDRPDAPPLTNLDRARARLGHRRRQRPRRRHQRHGPAVRRIGSACPSRPTTRRIRSPSGSTS